MKTSFNVTVSGTVCQHVEIIKEGLTAEELIKGLQTGAYITSVGESREVLETKNLTVVGKVISNEILDDMEYYDFGKE